MEKFSWPSFIEFIFFFSQPTALTRAAYAQLHSAGFPAISDSKGNPPFVVDPGELLRYDVGKEEGDALQCNEINLQFLAISM